MQTVIAPKSPLTKTTPVLHLPEAHLFPHVPQLFGSQRLTHAPPQQMALRLRVRARLPVGGSCAGAQRTIKICYAG